MAVVDNGSFTRAGERIGRTQSTVSLQIKKLEENLKRPLFERGSRELQVTSDGETLLGYARHLLQLADEARARLMEPDIEGTIRLGTTEDFATVYLPDILARFAQAHPRVILDVNCNFSFNLLEGFAKGEYDLVLIKREPQASTGGVPVWRDVLVWVCSPQFVIDPNLPLALALAPSPDVYRKRALHSLREAGRDWRIVYTSVSSEGLQAAVRAGLAVTVLSKDMMPPGLKIVGAEHHLPVLPDTEIALYRAPGRLARAVELLAEHITHSLQLRPKSDSEKLHPKLR